MAMKPRRFNGGGSVSGSEGSRVNIGAGAKGSTMGAPDSGMGPRIKEANKKKPLGGNFNRTEGPEPKKPEQKMRGGGMVKKPKKMRGGGMVKKMRGGGMVKKK